MTANTRLRRDHLLKKRRIRTSPAVMPPGLFVAPARLLGYHRDRCVLRPNRREVLSKGRSGTCSIPDRQSRTPAAGYRANRALYDADATFPPFLPDTDASSRARHAANIPST